MTQYGGNAAAGGGAPEVHDKAADPFAAIAALLEPPAGETAERLAETWPYGFALLPSGFHHIGDESGPPLFLTSPFRVVGFSRDAQNGGWGVVIAFDDRDGVPKTVVVGAADDGAAVLRRLAAAGLVIAGRKTARDRLIEALAGVQTTARVRLTDATGWDASFTSFVMPERTFGGMERFVFEGSTRAAHFGEQGDIAAWQAWVGKRVRGHDRLVFALAVAFVGPLLGALGAESAIWHIRGRSSSGKSTALRVGASVWGPPALVGSWRGTANGFEGTAALHSDLLLVLDELGLADARSVGDSTYMLIAGCAKQRMASDGSLKTGRRWRTNVLSSGELSLGDKIHEEGRRQMVTAGQGVRFIELPLDPARDLGIFDGQGTREEAAAMADAIKAAAAESYGTAGPAFLETLVADIPAARKAAAGFVETFMRNDVPDGVDGQVTRVARKFALVAAAGELAVQWGILPPCFAWGEVSEAASRMFACWLGERGGTGATEDRQAVMRVKAFLAAHASARLPPLRGEVDGDDSFRPSSFRAQMVAGYQDREHFLLNDGAFKEALCGLEPTAAADALFRQGFLAKSADANRRKIQVSTPEGRQRLYRISKLIMEFDDGL